ncbi:MAG: hypothetical protein JJU20_09060 [Opitutales bacterium]|nr:hypothetical protein [Opitutales bacterium]
MKNKLIISSILLAFGLGWVACSDESRDDVADGYEAAASQVRDASEETRIWFSDTWSHVAEFSSDQSDRFVETMGNAYDAVKSRGKDVIENNDDVTDEAAERFREAGRALEEQLDRAADAGSDGWDAAKEGVEEAWKDLQEAYKDLGDD